jgi:hypothetical protein
MSELDELLEKWAAENEATKETKMSATDQRHRALLISAGEHAYALKRLNKASYTVEEYLQAVELSREAGDGERYADSVLGPDVDLILSGTEDEGDELLALAGRDLESRGISLSDATYDQLSAALARVSE